MMYEPNSPKGQEKKINNSALSKYVGTFYGLNKALITKYSEVGSFQNTIQIKIRKKKEESGILRFHIFDLRYNY